MDKVIKTQLGTYDFTAVLRYLFSVINDILVFTVHTKNTYTTSGFDK